MSDDRFDAFEADLAALDGTLARSGEMTAVFTAELDRMQRGMSDTTRDMGNLSRAFSGSIRRAFEGVVFDGQRLSDTLATLKDRMSAAAYRAAVTPVTDQLGGMLSGGLNALVSGLMPFGQGGSFSQGRVMPFASGGVASGPVTFPMRRGTGLMGEAGPEAIMPLARGADGKLGVRTSGAPAPVHVTMNITTPDAASFERSRTQVAARLSRALAQGNRNR
ncbi:phage tail tape measure protein [Pelagovum pacificum]|uniref:Phage tail tape measure protein n=1 Tax=Pelagovum pacificum TaxID=2588711 RepID=A0A5C5GD77_9RHOB|nr:phage tail tape measure protein [Pelagovum pacificum]QQA41235.1 phage tail tape measure protein [Pelagovum pacificum]TNY31957.1 phage tail tape measure protein [Pelagovum pacificum]